MIKAIAPSPREGIGVISPRPGPGLNLPRGDVAPNLPPFRTGRRSDISSNPGANYM